MKTTYSVVTRDVDGTTLRKYRTLAGAVARFESMYGHPIATAMEEQYFNVSPIPALETLNRVRAVSDYGCTVYLHIIRPSTN